jgi:hypothetical protein
VKVVGANMKSEWVTRDIGAVGYLDFGGNWVFDYLSPGGSGHHESWWGNILGVLIFGVSSSQDLVRKSRRGSIRMRGWERVWI